MTSTYWAVWWVGEAVAIALLFFSWFGPMRQARRHSKAGRRLYLEGDTYANAGDYGKATDCFKLASAEYAEAMPLHRVAQRINWVAIFLTWFVLGTQIVLGKSFLSLL